MQNRGLKFGKAKTINKPDKGIVIKCPWEAIWLHQAKKQKLKFEAEVLMQQNKQKTWTLKMHFDHS